MADRDVTIDILATDKTKGGVTSAERNFSRYSNRVTRSLAQIGNQWTGVLRRMHSATGRWADSGDTVGKRFTRGILRGLDRLSNIGGRIGDALSKSISAAGPYVQLALVAILGTAAVAAAPVVATAITGGVLLGLGGGVLAAGIAAAARDPKVAAAFTRLKDRANKAFADFGEPFKGPLIRAADTFGDAVERMAPSFNRMGAALAPLVDRLAPAFAQMAEKSLPGIERAVKASAPIFEALAQSLPGLGASIGKFFDTISQGGPEAAQLIADIVDVVGFLIEHVGNVILALTKLYAWSRTVWVAFGTAALNALNIIITGAAKAFGWVPGIGPKLERAAADFAKFRDRVNSALSGIKDRNVKVRVNLTGNGARYITGNSPNNPSRPSSGGLSEFASSLGGFWRPAQVAAAFAGGGSFAANGQAGTQRTGGPTPVSVTTNVLLDGAPFRAMTARTVAESERRQAWRAKVGRR